MRTPYLGDTLVWTFSDVYDRNSYLASRRSGDLGYVGVAILGVLFVFAVVAAVARSSVSVMLLFVGAPLFWQIYRIHVNRNPGLTALRLHLLKRGFGVCEQYGAAHWSRDRSLGQFRATAFKSAIWVSDGCLFELKGVIVGRRHVFLHRGLFSSQDAIDALYRWAEEHKITIDGVPPLPGAYVRPIEERRGL